MAHYIEEKHNNQYEGIVFATRDHTGTEEYSQNREEQMKDYLSAAILMPWGIVKNKYEKAKNKKTEEFYNMVADDFKVSQEMATRRIGEVFND